MLDPRTLLIAISLDPCRAAEKLTDSSGALVPNATIVSPTIMLGIRRKRAMEEAPSTKKSAPLIRRIKPRINSVTVRTMMYRQIIKKSKIIIAYQKSNKSLAVGISVGMFASYIGRYSRD
jgi:hypothetical protein